MQAVNLCLLTSSAAERHAGRSRLLAVTQNLPYLPNLHVRGRKKNHQNVETSDKVRKPHLPRPAQNKPPTKMVDLNLKDFPGSQESTQADLSVGCQSPVDPARETRSSGYYFAHDAVRSALANDQSVMNSRFAGKFLLNFSTDNYTASKGINK
ncbi:hypothetical protein AV530_004334 [Patagioenas fasciata monilis]|uniref:Uncharacterized protein n=1 Tax=Patagioenas fasciata monilis TaxID=372326 RepID=A0A1V4K944_PATFA|nr:hypothetical protein AV530_004334 [Patagioenas fasciata monilis]